MSILANIGTILFIVIFFGFCIFIHEFGHLLAALWQKLHVEKFSIGFGKKIFGFTRNGVEYVVSWLPLGGYVSIPQLDPADIPKTEDGRELPVASPKARAIAAFAGPLFNILFGFLLAAVLWGVGVWRTPPASTCVVHDVPKILPLYNKEITRDDTIVAVNGIPWDKTLDDLAYDYLDLKEQLKLPPLDNLQPIEIEIKNQKGETKTIEYTPQPGLEWNAGLRKGDRIVAFNGKQLRKGYSELHEMHAYNGLPEATIQVKRAGQDDLIDIAYEQFPNPDYEDLGVPFFIATNPVALGNIIDGSPAQLAGFKPGDFILECNGQTVLTIHRFIESLQDPQLNEASIRISRNAEERTLLLKLPSQDTPRTATSIGLAFNVIIRNIFKDSPAEKAGLEPNDKILKLNGIDIAEAAEFIKLVKEAGPNPIDVTVERDGKTLEFKCIVPQKSGNRHLIGVHLDDERAKVLVHLSPWEQFSEVFGQTAKTLGLLFKPLTSAISGEKTSKSQVKIKHMSGVVGISALLWGTIKNDGLRGGLSLIVLITFSLAFVNLLPFPVLDGGHILFAAIEAIIRRRLPVKLVSFLQNAFAAMLIALMLYITFNDFTRLPRFFKAFQMAAPPTLEETQQQANESQDANETESQNKND